MRFTVSRTSLNFEQGDSPPCEQARKEETVTIVRRQPVNKDEEKFIANNVVPNSMMDKWTIEDGCFVSSKNKETDWFVDIPDLSSLLSFVAKTGGEIVLTCSGDRKDKHIEIYDDYRE